MLCDLLISSVADFPRPMNQSYCVACIYGDSWRKKKGQLKSERECHMNSQWRISAAHATWTGSDMLEQHIPQQRQHSMAYVWPNVRMVTASWRVIVLCYLSVSTILLPFLAWCVCLHVTRLTLHRWARTCSLSTHERHTQSQAVEWATCLPSTYHTLPYRIVDSDATTHNRRSL